uniref:Bifunctional inhibitor/plant lipid transfer protein/seed storage helical domain-containing protein n=1 Tax=Kalanchoe fedtschenkoi TaxID=63787 RepID=A0A7N0REI7_KALFE
MAASLTNSAVLIAKAALLLLLVATQARAQDGTSSCTAELNSLNVCAPFVLPNAGNPSAECCGALRAVPRDCVCSTIRISARLPSSCSLPPLDCDN